jgi:hypothetical protein
VVSSRHAFLTGIHFARDVVLFTLAGLTTVLFIGVLEYTLGFLLIFGLDIVGLVFLIIPRTTLNQLGLAWAGVMSIVLMVVAFSSIGNVYLVSDIIVILILSGVELLTIFKIGYDQFVQQNAEDAVY